MGSATVDVSANTHSQLLKIMSDGDEKDYIAYPSGTKIVMHNLGFSIGGGGTNTAVSFSRLGLRTAFLGKIGNDQNGKHVLSELTKDKVDFIGAVGGQTGYSVILDSLEKDRTILTFKGSNNDLRFDEIETGIIKPAWLYSSSMIETSYETMKQIFSLVKKNGGCVAFNPSSYQVKDGYMTLEDTLSLCDVLIMNKEESDLLFSDVDLQAFLLKHPQLYFIITDGGNGATCFYDGKQYTVTPSPNVRLVETTGAGDAFASGFVAGLAHHFSIEDALKIGMIQAESVIGHVGAKEGLLELNEVRNRLISYGGKMEDQHSFMLSDGTRLNGIDALFDALPTMDDNVFKYHTQHDNHFAKWVSDVYGLPDLAHHISEQQTKEELRSLLAKYKRGELHEN